MQVQNVRIETHELEGYIRKHGTAADGRDVYEVCVNKEQLDRETRNAITTGKVLYVELGLGDGRRILLMKESYKSKSDICILLPTVANNLWEELYSKYWSNPITVKFTVAR